MKLLAGPPVDLSAYMGKPLSADLLHEATDVIMRRITEQLAVLRGGTPPTDFYDMKAAAKPTTGAPK
jgi:hypothetical protein